MSPTACSKLSPRSLDVALSFVELSLTANTSDEAVTCRVEAADAGESRHAG